MNKLTLIFHPTLCIVIYTKGALLKVKMRAAIVYLQETYHTFVELQMILSFQILHQMNQTMILNIADTAAMIITAKIPGTAF